MQTVARWALAAIIGFLLLISVLLLADPLQAQPLQGAPVDQVVEALHGQCGEELIGDGVGPNGTRLLIFAHPDGDSWTVIGLLPDGKACPIAWGTDWTQRTPTPPGSET